MRLAEPYPLILVDDADREIGTGEKMQVHREGRLHRAFSIFVFDRRGRMLMQRRAATKYHSAGLWSNTCCGHPRSGESVVESGQRRLMEEMGFSCELRPVSSFVYRAEVGNGLVENEFDHVLFGRYDADPQPDAREVMQWAWLAYPDLLHDVGHRPEAYSTWLRVMLPSESVGGQIDRAARDATAAA